MSGTVPGLPYDWLDGELVPWETPTRRSNGCLFGASDWHREERERDKQRDAERKRRRRRQKAARKRNRRQR